MSPHVKMCVGLACIDRAHSFAKAFAVAALWNSFRPFPTDRNRRAAPALGISYQVCDFGQTPLLYFAALLACGCRATAFNAFARTSGRKRGGTDATYFDMAGDRAATGSFCCSRNADWLGPGRARPPRWSPHHLIGVFSGSRRYDSGEPTACDNRKNFRFLHKPRSHALAAGHFDGDGIYRGRRGAQARWPRLRCYHCRDVVVRHGGGQIALGLAGLVLGLIVVSGLRWVDYRMSQDQHATLSLTTDRDKPTQQEIFGPVQKAGYNIRVSSVAYINQSQQRQFEFLLKWRTSPQKLDVPPFLRELSSDPNVLTAQWKASS